MCSLGSNESIGSSLSHYLQQFKFQFISSYVINYYLCSKLKPDLSQLHFPYYIFIPVNCIARMKCTSCSKTVCTNILKLWLAHQWWLATLQEHMRLRLTVWLIASCNHNKSGISRLYPRSYLLNSDTTKWQSGTNGKSELNHCSLITAIAIVPSDICTI